MALSYHEIVKNIENNIEISNIPEEELNVWQKMLENALVEEKDQEQLAIKNIYLLLFLLKTKRSSLRAIKKYYAKIRAYFEGEEKVYRQKMQLTTTREEKTLIYNQLISFYKLVEFYISYMEESFYALSYKELKNEAYLDKLRFLQRHQLLEKRYLKFFSYTRLYFSHQLKRHTFLYAFLGFIGLILAWQGLWGSFDWVIAHLGWEEELWPYLINAIIGAFILFYIGLFLKEVGLEEELTHPRELRKLEELAQKRIKRRSGSSIVYNSIKPEGPNQAK